MEFKWKDNMSLEINLLVYETLLTIRLQFSENYQFSLE